MKLTRRVRLWLRSCNFWWLGEVFGGVMLSLCCSHLLLRLFYQWKLLWESENLALESLLQHLRSWLGLCPLRYFDQVFSFFVWAKGYRALLCWDQAEKPLRAHSALLCVLPHCTPECKSTLGSNQRTGKMSRRLLCRHFRGQHVQYVQAIPSCCLLFNRSMNR